MMNTLVSTASCEYNPETELYHLKRSISMICWSWQHPLQLLYTVMLLLALVLYYPAATFVVPALLFQDKSVDLKFKPSFSIIVAQFQLIMIVVSTFFEGRYNDHKIGVILVCGLLCLCLGMLCQHLQPCSVKRINHWRCGSFFASAWSVVPGLQIVYNNGEVMKHTWLTLFGGWIVIISMIILLDIRSRRRGVLRADGTVVTAGDGALIADNDGNPEEGREDEVLDMPDIHDDGISLVSIHNHTHGKSAHNAEYDTGSVAASSVGAPLLPR